MRDSLSRLPATDDPVSRPLLAAADRRPAGRPLPAQGGRHDDLHGTVLLGLLRGAAQSASAAAGHAADRDRRLGAVHRGRLSRVRVALDLCVDPAGADRQLARAGRVRPLDRCAVPVLPGDLLVLSDRGTDARHRLDAPSGNGHHQGAGRFRQRLSVAARRLGGVLGPLAGPPVRQGRRARRCCARPACCCASPSCGRRWRPASTSFSTCSPVRWPVRCSRSCRYVMPGRRRPRAASSRRRPPARRGTWPRPGSRRRATP